MTTVSAPPIVANPATPSAGPAATGNVAAAGNEALPADFASMLKALQALAGPNGPADQAAPEAKLARALAERRQAPGAEDESAAPTSPLDLGLVLAQLMPQVSPPGASQNAAAANQELSLDSEMAAPPRPGLSIATALAQERRGDQAAIMAGGEGAEPASEIRPAVPGTADPAAWRAAELAQARSAAPEPARLEVATPVQSPNWSGEVGQRVVWMARNNVQEAQLSINPPQLGPIEITLSLNDDQASARFVSPYAEVRDLLEQALPKLREMLAGAGVQLGQSEVGAQSQQAFQQFFGRHDGSPSGRQPSFRDEHPSLQTPGAVIKTAASRTLGGNGLVDTFV